MAILFTKTQRTLNVINSETNTVSRVNKVYPVITYKYSDPAKLKEVAKEISDMSGVSEGNAYSVLKDFRTYLKKTLVSGRIVNIEGLGYFYLAAKSEGTNTAEEFDATDITALRICFKANNDIRINTGTSTRTDGLVLKDVDKINQSVGNSSDTEEDTDGSDGSSTDDSGSGDGSGSTSDSGSDSGSGSGGGNDSGSSSGDPFDPYGT